MVENLRGKQLNLWPVAALVAADALILAGAPFALRLAAALVLLALLPGWLWAEALCPTLNSAAGRISLAVGLSLALTVPAAMAAVALPGALSLQTMLIAANLVIGGGWVAAQIRRACQNPVRQRISTFGLILLLVLLLATSLRLPRLGYAEFHEDEAEALMLGVRLLQGEDYALYLHRKGPAQMLVPVAVWLFSGHISEAAARLPFALSSVLSVAAVFALGRRWFGRRAALPAALLWAANGYAVAFGRMVQYQSLIFFWGVLSLYCLDVARARRQIGPAVAAAILLAASLLAHFDALLLLPAAGYLLAMALWQIRRDSPRRAALGLLLSAGLFALLLAVFYVPFVRDPEFQNTRTYLSESRVRPGLLYNNLDKLRRLDRDYSSRFYLPLLALGIAGLALANRGAGKPGNGDERKTGRRKDGVAAQSPSPFAHRHSPFIINTVLLLLAGTTFLWPKAWQAGSANLAVAPWLALLAAQFFASPLIATRSAWLLFGAPLVGYAFLVDDPRTHLYILYPGAVLLAGAGLDNLRSSILDFRWLRIHYHLLFATRYLLLGLLLIWVGLVVMYQTAIFLQTESGFAALRGRWSGSLWETVYNDIPTPREYFGYPKREGWKAIGALRAEGRFPGDFRSANEEFIIPIWYNFGQPRACTNTPDQLFIRLAGLEDSTSKEGYAATGQVQREGEIRLQIQSRGQSAPDAVETFAVEDYIAAFDRQATPQKFAGQNQPSRRLETQFGPAIQLTGADVPAAAHPGDVLAVNLYWLALAPPGDAYRAFVHLTDGAALLAQQDDDPACRLPTTLWRAGQHSVGQFRLAIPPETPPGRYPLIAGLYRADSLERLKITGGAGQPGDDFLWLGDVEISGVGN